MGLASAVMLTACNTQEAADEGVIGKQEITVENGIMTPEVMMAFGRVSSPAVSPDGTKVLFGVTYIDYKADKSNNDLFAVSLDGTRTQVTATPKSEQGAVWLDDNTIAFIYPDADNVPQLWKSAADGTSRVQLTSMEKGIEGFLFAPDGKQVLLVSTVKSGERASDLYPDLPKASGRVIDDLMYKHWDEWVEAIPHPFIATVGENGVSDIKDILEGEPYESPMRPFGGAESFAWAPDGKSLVYVCRKKTGMEYSLSTNSDLYLYNVADGTTRNLTEGMMGYDTNPVFSPDGKYLQRLSYGRLRLYRQQLRLGSRRQVDILYSPLSRRGAYLQRSFGRPCCYAGYRRLL